MAITLDQPKWILYRPREPQRMYITFSERPSGAHYRRTVSIPADTIIEAADHLRSQMSTDETECSGGSYDAGSPIRVLRPPLEGTFWLPSRDELLGLKPGDLVKLIFTDGSIPERMWVELIDCSSTDQWVGSLDNQPFGIEDFNPGDFVSFHPLDIIAYETNEDICEYQDRHGCNPLKDERKSDGSGEND